MDRNAHATLEIERLKLLHGELFSCDFCTIHKIKNCRAPRHNVCLLWVFNSSSYDERIEKRIEDKSW